MKAQFLIPLIAFILLTFLLMFGLSDDPRLVPSPLVDKPVPQFSLPVVEDATKTLTNKDLSGEVSLVNIWASWCVSCRAEHRLLNAMAQKGIPIYGINYKDELKDARRWLNAYGNPYKASGHDLDGRVGIEWGVYGTPETFIIDQQGVIRYKHVGPINVDDMEKIILPKINQLREKA